MSSRVFQYHRFGDHEITVQSHGDMGAEMTVIDHDNQKVGRASVTPISSDSLETVTLALSSGHSKLLTFNTSAEIMREFLETSLAFLKEYYPNDRRKLP